MSLLRRRKRGRSFLTTSAHLEGLNRANNDSFTLSGPSLKLDPARTPLRGDLADIALAGKVFAPHYAVPMPMRAMCGTPLLADMDAGASVIAHISAGAEFAALDIVGGYIWGYISDGGLVGFVAKDALVKVEIA
jgi:hypothetical protein